MPPHPCPEKTRKPPKNTRTPRENHKGIVPTPGGHFLKTQFLYKKIYAQQSAPKPPYVGRMNVGRGDRGEPYPGPPARVYAWYFKRQNNTPTYFFHYFCDIK